MALDYIYKKYKDVYTIENTGVVTLNYSIDTQGCNTTTLYKEGVIIPGQTFTLPINYTTGVYIVTLSYNIEEEILPPILQYNNLLISIINNTEEIMCGCKDCNCNDCDDQDQCMIKLNTLISDLSFSFVFNPVYSTYISIIADYLNCTINENVICYLTTQQITGKEETNDLYLQMVGLYYLAFYYYDLHQAIDDSEVTYIKNKYKFSKVSVCLKRNGINIDNIEDAFFNYPVYYWQLNNTVDTIIDVIPLISDAYLATKPVDSFKNFNQGKIIEYTLIGRIVFTIKNADSLNFILMDSLGNDITDQFDTYYDSVNKFALFVSMINYSYGNVYFKFKQQNI